VLALAFLGTILLGTGLLMLSWATASREGAPWLTALFIAASAVCVTGLVVVDTGSHWGRLGQVQVLALFQLGGFSMITSATLMGLLIGGHLKLRTRLLLQTETHALSMGRCALGGAHGVSGHADLRGRGGAGDQPAVARVPLSRGETQCWVNRLRCGAWRQRGCYWVGAFWQQRGALVGGVWPRGAGDR
jgi:hypothetical protein